VDQADAVRFKQTLQVKVIDFQEAAHLPCPVIVNLRTPRAETRVGDVELVPVSPGAALGDLRADIRDVPPAKLSLDE